MIKFLRGFFDRIATDGISFPILIAVVLSVAFIAMLLVTIFTLISIRRAELKSKRVIDIPPSALVNASKIEAPEASENSAPLPVGEWLNRYLIAKGYIKANDIVKSFFKALEFLKNSLGSGYKYKLPWFVLLGSEGSGKSSLMNGFTHDEIYDDELEDAPCTWWFLKNGVVLDVKGSVFLPKSGLNADEKSWNIMLNMLARYRAAKPLNGVILTIPADELYGKSKLQPEEIKKRAQYAARKLNFAQNYLGMKLPVYVVITKTDVVPGFQSFCSEIPVRNRGNMLGWSSPYAADVMYTSRMLDEGFSEFENELNSLRMEIFSQSYSTTTRDGVFVFPSELLTIKSSLEIYIDSIFKSSSAEERFYFRGFYFTGDSKMMPLLPFDGEAGGEESPMAIVGTPDADINEVGNVSATYKDEPLAAKKIFFFEDLLLKKVFAEDGLASPMKTKIHQSNKSILVAKISTAAFVVIGSYGLFSANDNLKSSKNSLYPSLFKISSLIKNASDLTFKNLERDGNEILSDCTTQLLSMMQQLSNTRFSSLFVPASWFSSINSDLTETLRSSYQRVVVRTIYMNLMLKARELLTTKPTSKSVSIAELLKPQNSAEYKQLKCYVFGLLELENNIKKFDSLRISGDPKDLNDLIDYTFHGSLPREFLDNYRQFRAILMNTPFPAINLSPYKKDAYNTLLLLFQNYINAIFTTRSNNSIMNFLTKFISQLSRQNLQEKPDCSSVIKFSNDLSTVCKELGKEGDTWLDKDIFEPDDEFNSFLDGVESLFGKDTAQKLLDITAANFNSLKAKFEKFNNSLQSDIPSKFSRSNPKYQVPSSGIFAMEACLSALCSEPFMEVPGDYQLITDIPAGKMIFWDDELVGYAYKIGQRYAQFIATNLKDFPRAMQEGIELLAKANLCAVIASTVAKSQSLVDAPTGLTEELTSEEILQKQVAELKGVAPKLVNLLKILRGDKFSFVFSNLRSVLNKVGFGLLSHIDRLLENQKPYYPNNLTFNFWNGETGAGLQAYSSSDMEELRLFLKLQRSMIRRLALDFAEPIVNFLNAEPVFDKNYGDYPQLTKWTRIVDNLNGLEKKDPTSSLAAVERFIRTTLNGYDLDNITSKISQKDFAVGSGDYFLELIKKIKRGVMARAEVLIRKRNIARYGSLRNYYVKHLENKYPFCNYDKSQRTANDASLDAVREFFKMYDEFGGSPEAILDQIHQLGDDAAIPYEFLKKVHELRLFFGDFFNSQYETLKVQLEMNFDVNRREEKNTDYLVDKVFHPNNDASIEPISSDKSGVWYFGEPIDISFRWAEGDEQSDLPTYDQNDPDLILDKNTAKIQCVGNWSVLRFLQKYRASTVNAEQLAPNEVVLGFRIPLSSGKIAKVFAGITASIPRKPGDPSVTTLKIPETPNKMPEMPKSVIAVQDEAVLVARATGEATDDDGASATICDADYPDIPEENNDTEKRAASVQKKTKATEKSATTQKQKKKKAEAREVSKILNSNEKIEMKDDEALIEVSEEPIG